MKQRTFTVVWAHRFGINEKGNLKGERVIWELGTSFEELLPSDWPGGKFVGCFLD